MGQIHGTNLGSPAAIVTSQGELITKTNFGTESIDAFERLKVSEPFSLSDNVFKYDLIPSQWESLATGSAVTTHLPDESAVNLRCGSADGDKVTFTQKKYNRYQAGRSFNLTMTAVVGSPMNGVIRRWGLFDNGDGVFYELSGTSLGVVQRSSVTGTPVDTRIEQSDWNADTADGSGNSLFNLDTTKNNIYNTDFQWLSAGRVRFGLETDNPKIGRLTVHNIENSNVINTPYMKTAVLPLRYEQEVVDDGTEGADFKAICSTTIIDGGGVPPEINFSASTGSAISVGADEVHLLSVRLSGTFKGIENRMMLLPRSFGLASEKKTSIFRILGNSTVTGDFTSVDDESGMEVIAGSTPFTAGIPFSTQVVSKDSNETILIDTFEESKRNALTLNASGTTSDVITIAAQAAAVSSDVTASMSWGEIR